MRPSTIADVIAGAVCIAIGVAAVFVLMGFGPGRYAVWPPAGFQGDAVVTVRFIDAANVDGACRDPADRRPARGRIHGCERDGVITVPNPCRWPNGSDLRDLLCHEMAHANGWPGTHPK